MLPDRERLLSKDVIVKSCVGSRGEMMTEFHLAQGSDVC